MDTRYTKPNYTDATLLLIGAINNPALLKCEGLSLINIFLRDTNFPDFNEHIFYVTKVKAVPHTYNDIKLIQSIGQVVESYQYVENDETFNVDVIKLSGKKLHLLQLLKKKPIAAAITTTEFTNAQTVWAGTTYFDKISQLLRSQTKYLCNFELNIERNKILS